MNFQAVLFDCDGVLVDSEPITNGVLRDMLEERGWLMSPEECFKFFVGKAVKDHKDTIEAKTGLPLTEEWLHTFRLRRNDALAAHLTVMPGAHAAVAAAYDMTQPRSSSMLRKTPLVMGSLSTSTPSQSKSTA